MYHKIHPQLVEKTSQLLLIKTFSVSIVQEARLSDALFSVKLNSRGLSSQITIRGSHT